MALEVRMGIFSHLLLLQSPLIEAFVTWDNQKHIHIIYSFIFILLIYYLFKQKQIYT